ncbi:MAG: hypothetical protein H7039_06260, partial [Bryobacteraceae bacterium]|nr:hypothetical protein [Bryobacteraceae bacterium]
VINRTTGLDAGQTINMHKAVELQTSLPRLFVTQPWAMAFKHQTWDGYVLSAASNVMIHVVADPTTGAAVVQNDPTDATRVQQISVGKNPRGIVINTQDTRAYVMNYVSRDISVIALTGGPERLIGSMQSANLPVPGSQEDIIHVGRELYNTSVGVFDAATEGGPFIRGRMSNNGWGSCGSCHPNSLTDNVVWIFPAGPRRTIPQNGDFDPESEGHAGMRMLNWSSNRDEQEDFELNIRGVSGGQGLIVLGNGVTPDPNVADFVPLASAGRNQLKVHGVNAWDAITEFVKFGMRTPISPLPKNDVDVVAGRELFVSANCQSCHGGASWTSSRVRFNPPPQAGQVVAGQLASELRPVGTFDPNVFNEVRQNAAAPLGAAGFVPPSLLGIHAYPQTFFHNGIASSLDQVMDNVTHRAAGTAGVDTLSNASDRSKLVKFLQSIDSATVPVTIP